MKEEIIIAGFGGQGVLSMGKILAYSCLLYTSTYNDADLNFSSYEKSELSSQLAYDGNWQAYFDYIADCLKRYASCLLYTSLRSVFRRKNPFSFLFCYKQGHFLNPVTEL